MSVKIIQVIINKKHPHIANSITSIEEYESFEKYLNLMAVERIKIPFYFKNISRSYNIEKQEVISEIFDLERKMNCILFGKVLEIEDGNMAGKQLS